MSPLRRSDDLWLLLAQADRALARLYAGAGATHTGAYDFIRKSHLRADLVPAILAAHAEQTTAPRGSRPAP